MGRNAVLLGMQWGDEGKGKIADCLTREAAAVARFQGGHNAGHTVVVGERQVILHLIPSGILHAGVDCLIGNGVVVSPAALLEELAVLEQHGMEPRKALGISPACHLILPSHIALDQAREQSLGRQAIGTTGRGIGPCYEDKAGRRGLRLGDLYAADFPSRLADLLDYHNFLLRERFQADGFPAEEMMEELRRQGEELRPMVQDVSARLDALRRAGKNILFEGAQGALLDIDHGSYPYVTSSNTIAGGAVSGTGFRLGAF